MNHAERVLEYESVLERLGSQCETVLGAERAAEVRPLWDAELVWDELAATAEAISFEPGDALCVEGAASNEVYAIAEGEALVTIAGKGAGSVGEGDVVGERGPLENRPRSATVTAAAPCELLELDREAFEEVCARHPRVRSVMEEVYIQRASHPLAARVRSAGRGE